jgi:hypothetical protein
MELLKMIVIIIIVISLIYFVNKNFECFTDFIKPLTEVENIKRNYNLLIKEVNYNSRANLINKIKTSIYNIETTLINNYDKYKLNNIYYNEIIPLFDKPNNNKFDLAIKKIEFLIEYSANNSYYEHSITINDIKNSFKDLNNLYRDVYITKITTYNKSKDNIDILTKKIFNLLLKITSHDDLNNSGIILILNTTLKRAYETNDTININSQILTFDEKIKQLNLKLGAFNNSEYKSTIRGVEVDIPATTIQPTTTISIHRDKEVIKLIQDDFNMIYNAFDVINVIYKNNGDKKQLKDLKEIIYKSIDNIISYNNTDIDYKNKISSIRSIIIAPILDKDLMNSYTKGDTNEIIKIKNKFYDGIVEIKNIIISNFSKTQNNNNRNVCLSAIIEAIMNNDYPIEVNKLKGCNNSIFLSNNDITIYPKLAISKDNGKNWEIATDLYEYKKSGIKDGQLLYSYKLASKEGKDQKWSFIS